jgi:hypothetical protein
MGSQQIDWKTVNDFTEKDEEDLYNFCAGDSEMEGNLLVMGGKAEGL